MKKRLWAVLLMAVILLMAGCGNSNSGEESVAPDIQMTENTDQADAEENISTEADNSLVSVVNLWDREDVARLSSEDAAVIATLFEGGSWREGTSDCANDCLMIIDDEEIQYHADCGTFNDGVNGKHLQLTEKQQAEVNTILEKYIVLDVGGIKE